MPNLAGYSPGRVVTFTAPGGGVSNGDVVQIGQVVGVAANDAVAGDPFELIVDGLFTALPKVSAQAWTEGALIYFDSGADLMTTVATGNALAGFAAAAAANPSATGSVRFNGSAHIDGA